MAANEGVRNQNCIGWYVEKWQGGIWENDFLKLRLRLRVRLKLSVFLVMFWWAESSRVLKLKEGNAGEFWYRKNYEIRKEFDW